MFGLPESIQALIIEFAGVEEQWKHRFTTDVLPMIDQGIRCTGVDVFEGTLEICINCYTYGPQKCNNHSSFESVSYADMKQYSCDPILRRIPSLPLEVYQWVAAEWQHWCKLRAIRCSIWIEICNKDERQATEHWIK